MSMYLDNESIKIMINQHFKFFSSSRVFSFFILLGLLFVSQAIKANPLLADVPNGDYTLDKDHASIVWKISHLGLSPYVARFTDFDMNLYLDTEDLSKSKVTAVVNATSINTENEKFNKDLISNKWFKTEKFPKVKFTSSSYKPKNDKEGVLQGELEMFGIKKIVDFDVKLGGTVASHPFIDNSAGVGFTAKTVIKRSDWKFRKFIPAIGDEVTIEITAEFFKEIDKQD